MRTGYSTVTRNILNRLSDEFECHCIGHNFWGQTICPPIKFIEDKPLNFTLHGTGKAKYAMDIITHKIREGKFDLFGCLLDSFMLFESGFLNVDTSPAKTFFYYPSDGGGCLPRDCEQVLRKVNQPIAMAKFGRDQVKKLYNIDSKYIPHGYDPDIYYQLSPEEKAKIRQEWALSGKFVIGIMSRNQGRKMLDRTIKAFALFCKDKPDAVLFLHLDPKDQAAAFDISRLILRFKIQNRCIFSGTTFLQPFSYKKMNEIYNLMDVLLHSSSGEGYGLCLNECQACGVPVVACDYTTSHQLIMEDGQSGEMVLLAGDKEPSPNPHCDEILNGTITGSWDVERGLMDIFDCVKKLDKLYKNKKLREHYGKVGIEKTKKLYTWDHTVNGPGGWKETLRELMKK